MKINILKFLFDLEYKEEVRDEKNELVYGTIDYKKHKILINNTMPKFQQDSTVLHEIIHGISSNMEADLTENQVSQLGVGLYNVLKDNKDFLLEYLKEL